MRMWLAVSIAGLLALAAVPAGADVDVLVTYDKDKTINVNETIDIDKTAIIRGFVEVDADMASEAEALINQRNSGNRACENCAEKRDRLINGASGNSGVVVLNQAAGNNNNQGSAISISVDTRVPPSQQPPEDKTGDGFANAQAAVDQVNGVRDNPHDGQTPGIASVNGPQSAGNVQDATNLLEKSAAIETSVDSNEGVVHVNQATGNMANQANALAMAVGFNEGGVSIAEADLGQVNIGNRVFESQSANAEFGIVKFANITDSVNNNSGVVGVNQSAGNMANQANVVSFAVVTTHANAAP